MPKKPSLVVELDNGVKIYQGNKLDAENVEYLQKCDIKYVVNATKHLENFGENYNIEYYRVYINDTVNDVFGQKLNDVTKWLHDKICKKNGNVFIHCHAGISRSSTITLSYMMKYLGYSLENAFIHLRRGRNIVNPNSSFWKELEGIDRENQKSKMCII